MNSRRSALVQAARGPVLLLLLGVLFAFQQAGALAFSRSWPLLIIAIGCMKLAERMWAGPNAFPPPPVANVPPPQPGRPPYQQSPSGMPSAQQRPPGEGPASRGTV